MEEEAKYPQGYSIYSIVSCPGKGRALVMLERIYSEWSKNSNMAQIKSILTSSSHCLENQKQLLTFFQNKCIYVCVCLITQSCPTLCDHMDCNPPGPSVIVILQARILEGVAMPSSRGCTNPAIEPKSPALQSGSLPYEPFYRKTFISPSKVIRFQLIKIANICWIIKKKREFQKNIYYCLIDQAKAFDCVDHH